MIERLRRYCRVGYGPVTYGTVRLTNLQATHVWSRSLHVKELFRYFEFTRTRLFQFEEFFSPAKSPFFKLSQYPNFWDAGGDRPWIQTLKNGHSRGFYVVFTKPNAKRNNLTGEPFCTMLCDIASEKMSGAISGKLPALKVPVHDKPDVMDAMGHLPERTFGHKTI